MPLVSFTDLRIRIYRNAPKGSEIIICTTSNGGHLNIMHVSLHGKNKHPLNILALLKCYLA